MVAALYGMSNVPSAAWIDEQGLVVRPAENSGSSDAWRFCLDRETGQLAAEGVADVEERRRIYLDAVRDWAANGAESTHVKAGRDDRGPSSQPTPDDARAAACFRLATHLLQTGDRPRAQHWLREAASLSPRTWRIKRELWTLDDPGNLAAGEFWDEIKTLGTEPYYEPPEIAGMPPQFTRGA